MTRAVTGVRRRLDRLGRVRLAARPPRRLDEGELDGVVLVVDVHLLVEEAEPRPLDPLDEVAVVEERRAPVRAELQALIAEKQAERRAMKKAHQAAEDARDARAKAAVLLEHELAEQKGRERKAELDLAWQKQEIDLARARKREAREKKAGRDYGGVIAN